MTDIDAVMAKLNSAKGARLALEWFKNHPHHLSLEHPTLSLQLACGNATPEGKAATQYLRLAFREILPKLLEYAQSHAEADVLEGNRLVTMLS